MPVEAPAERGGFPFLWCELWYDEAMDRATVAAFLAKQPLAVEASVASDGRPQAAVMAIVANEQLEVFFETDVHARKVQNLRRDPRIALVVWEGATTVQYEGLVDEPRGEELERLLAAFYAKFPDAQGRGPSAVYFRAKPTWIRYSPMVDGKPVQHELTEF